MHLLFSLGILVIILLGGMISVSAGEYPDMIGSWTAISVEQYTPEGGFENQTRNFLSFHITEQDGRSFVGETTYYDEITGKNITEKISAIISPDGRTFEIDNEGSGISFGEIVSDHEHHFTTLFSERGPMILAFHMVKTGTPGSPSENLPNLIGAWNTTHNRKDASSSDGLLTIDSQLGRIWSGTEEMEDEDGTWIHEPIAGTVGETGNVFATTTGGALMIGSVTGNDTIESALIIPGDTDGTNVIDRIMTKNGTSVASSEHSYPDLTGDWKIESRKKIENGRITDDGPINDVWFSFSNQTGPFFKVFKYSQSAPTQPEGTLSGIFRSPEEAYLTCEKSCVIIYYVLDNSTIEATVNQKDNNALMYLDRLTRTSV